MEPLSGQGCNQGVFFTEGIDIYAKGLVRIWQFNAQALSYLKMIFL